MVRIMKLKSEKVKIAINNYEVSAELLIPDGFKQAFIIANGAGANMHSDFISRYHQKFAGNGLMTIKFNFHYQETGRKIPDKNEKCQETYLAIIDFIKSHYIGESQIAIGGKSMGGRIATQIAGKVSCSKIVVFGYPLHPPGKAEKLRDAHLYPIQQQILFIQGERDAFGNKLEMDPVVNKMKQARIFYIPQGNHSLKAPKKSGLDNKQLEETIFQNVTKFLSN